MTAAEKTFQLPNELRAEWGRLCEERDAVTETREAVLDLLMACRAAGYSQAFLASKLGVSQQRISQLEAQARQIGDVDNV